MNAHTRESAMSFEPNETNTRALRDAFSRFATGVTVVTCASQDGPVAITANSFSSVSLTPPLVMWAAAHRSRRYPAFAAAPHFAIHVLGAEQRELCEVFAADGFALSRVDHTTSPEGTPLIPGCLARFECRLHDRHAAGDHSIMVGQVLRAQERPGDGLTFFGGSFARLEQP